MWRIQGGKKKIILALVVLLLITSLPLIYYVNSYLPWLKTAEDSIVAMSWEGFGPEKGLYNYTVVTAMLDIGRGSWDQQSRSYNTYLLYMQQLLRMDMNIVVFVEQKGKPFVDWMRRGREDRTFVVVTDITSLPYYRYRDRMSEIMRSPEYQRDNELYQKKLCESYVPEYDILQLSKLYFLNVSIIQNPFHTSYFIWIDGGYGHGQEIYPPEGVWIPKDLFEHSHKMTFIERDPGVRQFEKVKDKLYKMSINILPGGFFGGGVKAVQEVYALQRSMLREWMEEGVVDDDQTMYMLMFYRRPSLFRLVPGDWHDAFKLFHRSRPQR
ncbi:protein HtrL-like [Physella acuta]|uniref:protein HtrL-like n=1 Tax=Physella acuta TaxID=109671 RepID=UPI0027DB05B9|nr:protein HtrL-like [Physella acuta]